MSAPSTHRSPARRVLVALSLVMAACGGDDGAADGGDDALDVTPDAADVAEADAAGPDGGDVYIPPLEKVSKVEFKVGGVTNRFDINGRADYIAAEQQLKISASKGTRKIELNLLPVEPFAVGHWADTVFSDTGVVVCYNDGTGNFGELSSCGLGFTHESIAYDVTVTANNGPGSYVEGTFSATLESASGDLVEVTDGVFEVKHR